MYRLANKTTKRKNRAVEFMEMAFIMPAILMFFVFLIDMGSAILHYGALQDVAYASSRAGASSGGGNFNGNNISYNYLATSIQDAPGFGAGVTAMQGVNPGPNQVSFELAEGARCDDTRQINGASSNRVVVKVAYVPNMLTPGMSTVLGLINSGDGNGAGWKMTATAMARCEIVR